MGKKWERSQTIALTRRELSNVLEYAHEIIDNLPDRAIYELLQGNDKDVDNLLDDVMSAIYQVFHVNDYSAKKFGGLDNFEIAFDDGMKRLSYNYFKTTMLPNFVQGWRNLEWGNLSQLFPWSLYLAARGHGKSFEFTFSWPLWRMWRYRRVNFLQKDTLDNKNSKETVLITNESKLARKHMKKVVEEIRMNDLLKQILMPERERDLGSDKITALNGASLEFRTYGGFIRGLHVGGVVYDDLLDESCLYSEEQRQKFEEIFYGAIVSIVEPGGFLLGSGTPYHEEDLYQKIKKDPKFKVFEYPAIFPDGTRLSPERFTYKEIMDLKRSLGSIVFSREYLVTPVSDSSSLFPWEYLNKSFIGTENVSYVDNIDSFPIKLNRVVMGCDFAISGQIAADYSVFTVWGIDENGIYYLLHVWRKKGASHREQVDVIVRLNQMFKCNKIVAESNGFQKIMVELVKERGVNNIEPFTTTAGVKKDSYEGLPSISAMFERGELKLPGKVGADKDKSLWLCGEFNSITYKEDSGKLESAGATDDGAMSSFFALSDLREKKSSFKVHYV